MKESSCFENWTSVKASPAGKREIKRDAPYGSSLETSLLYFEHGLVELSFFSFFFSSLSNKKQRNEN